jgi:hypothetical protein
MKTNQAIQREIPALCAGQAHAPTSSAAPKTVFGRILNGGVELGLASRVDPLDRERTEKGAHAAHFG